MRIYDFLSFPGFIKYDIIYYKKNKQIKTVEYEVHSISCFGNVDIYRSEYHVIDFERTLKILPVLEIELPLGNYHEEPKGSKIFDEILDYVDKNT